MKGEFTIPDLTPGDYKLSISYLVHALVQAASGKSETELLVISGHDTNLSNLLGMFGLSWLLPSYQEDVAPPGSALIFTLWRAHGTGRYSVRLQFAAQTLDQMGDLTVLSMANPPAIGLSVQPGIFRASARGAILDGFTGNFKFTDH